METQASKLIETWPEESREAARQLLEKYGEPDEIADSRLVWYREDPPRSIVASRELPEKAADPGRQGAADGEPEKTGEGQPPADPPDPVSGFAPGYNSGQF